LQGGFPADLSAACQPEVRREHSSHGLSGSSSRTSAMVRAPPLDLGEQRTGCLNAARGCPPAPRFRVLLPTAGRKLTTVPCVSRIASPTEAGTEQFVAAIEGGRENEATLAILPW
jgi:hypothetical protein